MMTITGNLQLLAFASFFALLVTWVAWAKGFYQFPLPRLETAHLRLWELLGAFGIFLSVFSFVVPGLTMLWLFWKNSSLSSLDPLQRGWLNVLSIMCTALGIGLYNKLLTQRAREAVWGPAAFKGYGRIAHDLKMGAVTWIVSFPIVLVVGQICKILMSLNFDLSEHEQVAVKQLKTLTGYPALFGVMSLLIVSIVPMIEETLFRGCLQTWLKQKLGRFWAILLASVIFALFHFSITQGLDNVELLTSLFLLSCFLGYIYERQQSLWASIGLHSTFNAISILMILNS